MPRDTSEPNPTPISDPWARREPIREQSPGWRFAGGVVAGAWGPTLLLYLQGFRGRAVVVAGLAIVFGLLLRVLAKSTSGFLASGLVIAVTSAATWSVIGRAPTAVALLGVVLGLVATGSVAAPRPMTYTSTPQEPGLTPALRSGATLLWVGLYNVLWVRFEWPALNAVLWLFGLGLLWVVAANRQRVETVETRVARFVQRLGRAVGMALMAIVSTLLLYLPWCIKQVGRAARRLVGVDNSNARWASSRGTSWEKVQWDQATERRDGGRPFSSAPPGVARARVARSALACVALGLALVVGPAEWVNVGPNATVTTHPGPAQPGPNAEAQPVPPGNTGTKTVFDQAVAQPLSVVPAFADAPWADEMKAEQDRISNAGLRPTGPLTYEVRDFAGKYTNVSNGARSTLTEPDCAKCPILRVWLVGGSAAFGMGQRDDHTIASDLARIGAANGVRLEITNYGVPGFTTWQAVEVTRQRVLGAADPPSLVVCYTGFNDVAGTVVDGTLHGLGGSAPAILNGDDVVEFSRRNSNPSVVGTVDQFAAVAVAKFEAAIQHATDRPAQAGVRWLFVIQPDAFASPGQLAGVHTPYSVTPEAKKFLGSVLNVFEARVPRGVVDVRHVFDDEQRPLFADFVHTNERGAQMVAERIYPVVVEHASSPTGTGD